MAFLGVLVSGAFTSASASAHEFVASGLGSLGGHQTKPLELKLLGAIQECKNSTVTGKVTQLKTGTQVVTVQYEHCLDFGAKVKWSPVEYELNANGSVKILKTVTLTYEGCTTEIVAQSPGGTVTYANAAKAIETQMSLTHVEAKGKGSLCTFTEKEGTIKGGMTTELIGGTLEWM